MNELYKQWLVFEQTLNLWDRWLSPFNQNSSDRLNSLTQGFQEVASLQIMAVPCTKLLHFQQAQFSWRALFLPENISIAPGLERRKASCSCSLKSPRISSEWISLGHVPTPNQALQPEGQDVLDGQAWVTSRAGSPRKTHMFCYPKKREWASWGQNNRYVLPLPMPLQFWNPVTGAIWLEEP